MANFAFQRYLNNRFIPNSIKDEYKNEIKTAKSKYGYSYRKRRQNGFKSLFPMAWIYLLVICSCIFLKFFCENFEPLSNWLDENDSIAKIVVIFWMILVVVGIVMTFKSFNYVSEKFSKALSDFGSEYEEQKKSIVEKYNEMGYYPQYESIEEAIKSDRGCAYRDSYDDLRCPIDDSYISYSSKTYNMCSSQNPYVCLRCDKLNEFINNSISS